MTTSTDARDVPTGINVATPGDWFPLRLPTGPADIDVLLNEQQANHPGLAERRSQFWALLTNLVDATAAVNTVCFFGGLLQVPGGPLPATALGIIVDAHGQTLDDVVREYSSAQADRRPLYDVATFDLPAGKAVRAECLQRNKSDDPVVDVLALVVQYYFVVPGTEKFLMLTFSTAAVALAERLRELFHQIACTVTFTYDEVAGPSSAD